jgi:hypothetical protein
MHNIGKKAHTVFALFGIAFYLMENEKGLIGPSGTNHLVSLLEARESHLRNRVLFMASFGSRQERGICRKREVNTREAGNTLASFGTDEKGSLRDKICLELVQVDVE